MRPIYCPACALRTSFNRFEFLCPTGRSLHAQLGHAITNAVYRVDAPKTEPRKPGPVGDLTCPSCTADLIEFTSNDRFLRCSYCAFELPVTALPELNEFRLDHPDRDDPDGDGEIYDT
ncbi:hypothetical protein [Roseateles saccharophilus]|uniref:hypothetical protein n=1 Tax=Roseateles saccharophilus TaxID=304 RepID=UPI00105400C0|nr:hypothetical protein [Roseateles saccharophilus]MDG0833772.1 hypothetical protein [Roseateles saccharophilus]